MTGNAATVDADPMDYYEEYSEWLMRNELIINRDDLIGKFEDAWRFDEFLAGRKL